MRQIVRYLAITPTENHEVTRSVTVATELLVLPSLGGDPEPTPGPRAIECPIAGSRSQHLLTAHSSGLLRHKFGNGVPMAGFVRVAFVVLTVVGGAGIPLYLAGLMLLPEEGSDQSIAGSFIKSRQSRSR